MKHLGLAMVSDDYVFPSATLHISQSDLVINLTLFGFICTGSKEKEFNGGIG
jgi:hypothetical protein